MNVKRRCSSVAVALLSVAVAVSGRASAQESAPPPSSQPPAVGGSVGYFGEHGQIAITGELQFNILKEVRTMGAGSDTSFQLQPALDYFVSTNVSVGALVGVRRDPFSDGSHTTTIMIAPRVGYNIPIGNVLSLWINGILAYEHQSTSGGAGFSFSGYAIPLTVYAPLLWHPAPHFFIGFGPSLRTDLVSKVEGDNAARRTDFGLSSTVGGYFGGL